MLILKNIMPGTEKNSIHQNTEKDKRDVQDDEIQIAESLKQAGKDIQKDPDLARNTDPAANLDEGELARFESEE